MCTETTAEVLLLICECTHFGEVELERVVGGQGDHEAPGQILWQWVAVVAEEQTVVAQRRHGDANLGQVVQILEYRSLNASQRRKNTRPQLITAALNGLLSALIGFTLM